MEDKLFDALLNEQANRIKTLSEKLADIAEGVKRTQELIDDLKVIHAQINESFTNYHFEWKPEYFTQEEDESNDR